MEEMLLKNGGTSTAQMRQNFGQLRHDGSDTERSSAGVHYRDRLHCAAQSCAPKITRRNPGSKADHRCIRIFQDRSDSETGGPTAFLNAKGIPFVD
uniref:Uncharacterized protein n=1 Tax=Trichuris muris TaxID=70415 RepID=A0A5S6QBM6_TRIMR